MVVPDGGGERAGQGGLPCAELSAEVNNIARPEFLGDRGGLSLECGDPFDGDGVEFGIGAAQCS